MPARSAGLQLLGRLQPLHHHGAVDDRHRPEADEDRQLLLARQQEYGEDKNGNYSEPATHISTKYNYFLTNYTGKTNKVTQNVAKLLLIIN